MFVGSEEQDTVSKSPITFLVKQNGHWKGFHYLADVWHLFLKMLVKSNVKCFMHFDGVIMNTVCWVLPVMLGYVRVTSIELNMINNGWVFPWMMMTILSISFVSNCFIFNNSFMIDRLLSISTLIIRLFTSAVQVSINYFECLPCAIFHKWMKAKPWQVLF